MARKKDPTLKHIHSALTSLTKAQLEMNEKVERHEKILDSQGADIANLERKVMEYRNTAIKSEVKAGSSQRDVADSYNLSPARVNQIVNNR